jgi:transaldolase
VPESLDALDDGEYLRAIPLQLYGAHATDAAKGRQGAWARVGDLHEDGMIVIRELAELFAIHDIKSEVLAASIRGPLHVTQAALAGAHVATIPFKILQQMVHHPLTDKGIVQFRKDWDEARKAAAKNHGAS